MSRIGQKPIDIPKEVTVHSTGNTVDVVGPKGKTIVTLSDGINLKIDNNQLKVTQEKQMSYLSGLDGLNRTLLNNALIGVTNLWTKSLELVGVGFRAESDGKKLTLSLGFSHPIVIDAPDDITFSVAENKIIISGVDKYLVGELAAKIRRFKPPEPYKGKGIRYSGEVVRKKAGKATKAVGGAAGAK